MKKSLCDTCSRTDKDCPIYPQHIEKCTEYRKKARVILSCVKEGKRVNLYSNGKKINYSI